MITTILHTLGQFFLTQWLWSVTWGIYHALFAALFMIVLLRFFLRLPLLRSCFFSLGAQCWSFFLYSLFVVGVLIIAIELRYLPDSLHSTTKDTNFFMVAFNLGLIYAVLQTFFFILMSRWYTLDLRILFLLSVISNILAAWIVYLFLPVNM